MPTVEGARGGLPPPELARLTYCFEQGTPAYSKVRWHDGWYVGVHMDGLPFMEVLHSEGAWGIGRKISV